MGVERGVDLRVQRRVRLHGEPAAAPAPRVGTQTSVLARAEAWQAMIRLPGVGNRAGLAAKLGVSRSRITQGMAVLAAPAPVLEAIRRAEASGGRVTESVWRRVSGMGTAEAVRLLETT